MPSFTATRLQLVVSGGTGTFEPARFTATPLRLVFSGGEAVLGPGTGSTSLTVTSPTLNRLNRLIDKASGETDKQFQRRQQIWQTTMEAIEAAFAALTEQVNDNSNLLAQILAANALAQAANTTASQVRAATSLASSYTDPVSVLSADNTGAITVAAHTRRYTDGTSASVDAGSLSGFANGAFVTVFYEDAGREGGAVTYQGTTGATSQEGNRHIVGSVTIPQAGDPPASGNSPTAPGFTPPPDLTGFDGDYPER